MVPYLKVSKSQKQFMVSSISQKMNVGMILCTENYPNIRFWGELRTPQYALSHCGADLDLTFTSKRQI